MKSPKSLDAWLDDRFIGRFTQTVNSARFEYADPDGPLISLSLPRSGRWSVNAPFNFLDNLLPDDPAVRSNMRRTLAADSTNTFDLLERVGQDIAGALIIVPADTRPDIASEAYRPATDDEIADRIQVLKRTPNAWVDPIWKPRFSLAGAQAKFALARHDGAWHWSSASDPSTHIVKPGSNAFTDVESNELASMRLAELVGLPVPRTSLLTVFDQTAYLVERFDRDTSVTPTRRLRTEDLLQAFGLASRHKYDLTAAQVVWRLHTADPTDESGYRFIERLAFNTAIENADAHAKNYSLFINDDEVAVTPLYDVLVTSAWLGLDTELAMPIAGTKHSAEVTPAHWARLADIAELDADRVVSIATKTSKLVVDRFDEAFADAPANLRDRCRTILAHANKNMVSQGPVRVQAERRLTTAKPFATVPDSVPEDDLEL